MKAYIFIFLIGLGLGGYLFFSNPWLMADYRSDSYGWFVAFSQSIFQPQTAYYAESILLPLIGKFTGLSRSIILYKSLCAVITLSILPIIGVLAQQYFHNFIKALLLTFLFGFSYSYLQYYILGFPDPLTILLMSIAIFQKNLRIFFALLVLGMLSHFSMAVLGAIGLAALLYFSPTDNIHSSRKKVGIIFASIVTSKLILLAWYHFFHYQLISRLDWVMGRGYVFFLDRYESDVWGFWLTPSISFLVLFSLITTYFLFQKKYMFIVTAVFALIVAYTALFWTVDGLRVFAVIIVAPYIYLLKGFIESIWSKTNMNR